MMRKILLLPLIFIVNLSFAQVIQDFTIDNESSDNNSSTTDIFFYSDESANSQTGRKSISVDLTIYDANPGNKYGTIYLVRKKNNSDSNEEFFITTYNASTYDINDEMEINEDVILEHGLAENSEIFIRICRSNNCGNAIYSNFFQVKELDALVANAGSDKTIACGVSTTIGAGTTASGGESPYTYSWSPSSSLSNSSAANPSASPSSPTTYTLTVTDANGRQATDQVLVDLITPNAPAIQGNHTYYIPCDNDGWVTRNYAVDLTSGGIIIPKRKRIVSNVNFSSIEWSTEFGQITGYIYEDGLRVGVEISYGNIGIMPKGAKSSTSKNSDRPFLGDTFLVSYTAYYDCGSVSNDMTVTIGYPVCAPQKIGLEKNNGFVLSSNPTINGDIKIRTNATLSKEDNVNISMYDSFGNPVLENQNLDFSKGSELEIGKGLNLEKGIYKIVISAGDYKEIKTLLIK